MYSFCIYYAINTFEFPQILRGKGLNRRVKKSNCCLEGLGLRWGHADESPTLTPPPSYTLLRLLTADLKRTK